MKRCPQCHRMGIEFDRERYRCVWNDCSYSSKEYIEPEIPQKFKKFYEVLNQEVEIN